VCWTSNDLLERLKNILILELKSLVTSLLDILAVPKYHGSCCRRVCDEPTPDVVFLRHGCCLHALKGLELPFIILVAVVKVIELTPIGHAGCLCAAEPKLGGWRALYLNKKSCAGEPST